ncbi:MAG: metallophosphoesterase [Treponemataceae bacterium]|nr:metallophosphoesterase [Treponemataceae bacterium]
MRGRRCVSCRPAVLAGALLLCVALVPSCNLEGYGLDELFYRENAVGSRAHELKELSGTDAPDDSEIPASGAYTVLVITDVHFGGENSGVCGGRRDDEFLAAIGALSGGGRPKFCICLGDVAEYGREGEYRAYLDFIGKLEALGIRTYTVVGNHDLYNSGWTQFERLVFPHTSFYHFKTRNFSWYFADSAGGSLGERQSAALLRAMRSDPAPKIVSMHVPLYAGGLFYYSAQNTEERNHLLSGFAKNDVRLLLVGHTHKEIHSDFGAFVEENIPAYLEKRGYALVTVDEDGGTASCSIRYLDGGA